MPPEGSLLSPHRQKQKHKHKHKHKHRQISQARFCRLHLANHSLSSRRSLSFTHRPLICPPACCPHLCHWSYSCRLAATASQPTHAKVVLRAPITFFASPHHRPSSHPSIVVLGADCACADLVTLRREGPPRPQHPARWPGAMYQATPSVSRSLNGMGNELSDGSGTINPAALDSSGMTRATLIFTEPLSSLLNATT